VLISQVEKLVIKKIRCKVCSYSSKTDANGFPAPSNKSASLLRAARPFVQPGEPGLVTDIVKGPFSETPSASFLNTL
jgi:hypothetical protein